MSLASSQGHRPPVHSSNDSGSIEIRIVDYQYPANSRARHDADWVRVEAITTQSQDNWRFTDPCLLRWEALALAAWLDGWGDSTEADIGFIGISRELLRPSGRRGIALRASRILCSSQSIL
jgi:hypothetical protein